MHTLNNLTEKPDGTLILGGRKQLLSNPDTNLFTALQSCERSELELSLHCSFCTKHDHPEDSNLGLRLQQTRQARNPVKFQLSLGYSNIINKRLSLNGIWSNTYLTLVTLDVKTSIQSNNSDSFILPGFWHDGQLAHTAARSKFSG